MSTAELPPAAAQAREYLAQQELIIDGLCESSTNPAPYLGGLGQEKTRELAEERASNAKCGNILCKNELSTRYPSCPPNSVAILRSNHMEVVRGRDLEQFCSEQCFLSFRALVATRPEGDVWTMQMLALKSAVPNVKPKASFVGEIKEKETKRVKKSSANVDAEVKNKKEVRFAPQLVSSTIELPAVNKQQKKQQRVQFTRNVEEFFDDDDDEEMEPFEAELDEGIFSLVERLDFSTVEVNLFTAVSHHLMQLCTKMSKQWLTSANREESNVDLNKINAALLQGVVSSIDLLSSSSEDVVEFKPKVIKLLSRFDSTRPMSNSTNLRKGHWLLLTCALLQAMGWNGGQILQRFTFVDAELETIDSALLQSLVWMVQNYE